jgi:hypothetical protein
MNAGGRFLPLEMENSGIPRRILWLGLAVLWLCGTAAGLAAMAAYANRPGAPAHAPTRWPTASRMTLDSTRRTLVMLAHPKCDCTRASVSELAELMARAPHQTRAYVVFMKPTGVEGDWERTDLWSAAARIPDVSVLVDDNGREAERFGAQTSGQTLLYDAAGRLVFAGGTTVARGHEGDNPGFAAILALVTEGRTAQATSPVFGCPLFDEQSGQLRESKPHEE